MSYKPMFHFIETGQMNWSVDLLTKFHYNGQTVFIQIGNKDFCPIGGYESGCRVGPDNFDVDNDAKLNSQENIYDKV